VDGFQAWYTLCMLRRARPHDSGPIAEVFLASRRTFLPYAPLARSSPEVRRWVDDTLVVTRTVWVHEEGGRITGFAAWTQTAEAGWIDHIYVLPGETGKGAGAQLLAQALQDLKRPVRLYTFQANEGARRFYERHGFRAIRFGDGSDNEERCPDVLYEYP